MARGGYRPGAGRPKGAKSKNVKARPQKKKPQVPADIAAEAAAENLTPLEYMQRVMNDPKAEKDRRDRMAVAAAPFVHPRPGTGKGKKEERGEKASVAGKGKFSQGRAPLSVVK